MELAHWYKKDVALTWQGHRLSFAVAQELFSSHEVDAGSKLLLRSLEGISFPERGHCVDFGCGYGVLGLAWKAVYPAWHVTMIDRDALAVAFARHNAEHQGWRVPDDVESVGGLSVGGSDVPESDLIFWNVPGKAGEQVIHALTLDALDALTRDGLLVLVIVNPLADVIRDATAQRDDARVTHDDQASDHAVLHIQHVTGGMTSDAGDPFAAGVFDRPEVTIEHGAQAYRLRPVIGVPEYDSLSYASALLVDALSDIEQSVDWLACAGVGQGHVPIVAMQTMTPNALTLVDADLLALRASQRALADNGVGSAHIRFCHEIDLKGIVPNDRQGDDRGFVTLRLEDQVRPEVHARRAADLADQLWAGDVVLAAGTSTPVTRFLAAAKKQGGFRERSRRKRHGASVAMLTRR